MAPQELRAKLRLATGYETQHLALYAVELDQTDPTSLHYIEKIEASQKSLSQQRKELIRESCHVAVDDAVQVTWLSRYNK